MRSPGVGRVRYAQRPYKPKGAGSIPAAPIIDLHGLRRDEVEPILDRELNRLFMAGERECFVLVGRGAVVAPLAFAMLSAHPLVESVTDHNGRLRVSLVEKDEDMPRRTL